MFVFPVSVLPVQRGAADLGAHPLLPLTPEHRAKSLLGCSRSRGLSVAWEHCRDFCSSALALLMPLGKRLLPLPDSSLVPREGKIHLFSMAQLRVFLFFKESVLYSPALGPVPRLAF